MKGLSRFLLVLLAALAAPALAFAQTVDPVRPDDRTMGSAEAPVTLTVYLSTTCPHCAEWHTRDFPAFKARYVDTGQVRVAFRDLPTPPQDIAIAGAVMARCAPAERYDVALDALFQGQSQLRAQPGPPSDETVVGWLAAAGQAAGLTREQMNACFASGTGFEEIQARAEQSLSEGVDSTPSFFLNGQPLPDTMMSRDVTAFEPLIQPLLDGR